ncbi:hypothetical protein OQA88_11022 [Cercophora sp. LCS_1]
MTTLAPPPVANPTLLDCERQALLTMDDDASSCTENGSGDVSLSPDAIRRFGAEEIPWATMGVLLLGVFVVNSDSAVLFTLFHAVASDFNKLSSASWIVTSYTMGLIATQALVGYYRTLHETSEANPAQYGKLSDIFGRKPLLLVAYSCTLIGSIIGGCAFSFPWVLAGRTVAGMGNAGMMALISTIILDLVPIEDVAVWRSYVYAVNQIGRSTGLPIGGLIADNFHWRWSLLLPAPFMLFGLLYLWKDLSLPSPPQTKTFDEAESANESKLKRIDFSGAITLGVANLALLLFYDRMQRDPETAIHDPWTLLPLSSWFGFLLIFLGVEAFVAQEPILPLRMLVRRNVATSYCVQFTQGAIIMAFYTTVPLYFRIENGDTSTTAALRIATGLYRLVINIATVISLITFLVIFIRWRGETGWLDTICLCFPVGFSFGISLSAAFIGLAASVEPEHMAVSTSGFYLAMNIGSLTGVSTAATLISVSARRILREDLKGLPNADEIIRNVTSSLEGIKDLPEDIAKTVRLGYTESFPWVWLLGVAFCSISLIASFVMLEGQLTPQPSSQFSDGQGYGTFGAGGSSDTLTEDEQDDVLDASAGNRQDA